jgi:dihydroorotate dehydrogenase electron transfer subunit
MFLKILKRIFRLFTPLIHLAKTDCINTFLLGARTEEELPFVDILDECTNLLIATDDGSLGFNGFV